jgi:hypothetical protein
MNFYSVKNKKKVINIILMDLIIKKHFFTIIKTF